MDIPAELEVFTVQEMRTNPHEFLTEVDDRGAVYLVRHPRGKETSRLYKIIAMGPTRIPIKHHGVRPKKANCDPIRIEEML